MSDESSKLKRCPRCETEKHRTEFTTQGYCRPCSRDYSREREASKRGSPPAPRKPGKTVREIVDRVVAQPAQEPTPSNRPGVMSLTITSDGRRTAIVRAVAPELAKYLLDGEEIEFRASFIAGCIVIEQAQIFEGPQ